MREIVEHRSWIINHTAVWLKWLKWKSSSFDELWLQFWSWKFQARIGLPRLAFNVHFVKEFETKTDYSRGILIAENAVFIECFQSKQPSLRLFSYDVNIWTSSTLGNQQLFHQFMKKNDENVLVWRMLIWFGDWKTRINDKIFTFVISLPNTVGQTTFSTM